MVWLLGAISTGLLCAFLAWKVTDDPYQGVHRHAAYPARHRLSDLTEPTTRLWCGRRWE
jgi:hypothetical protein